MLITTALEETWVDDEPVLFLGEWCRLYSRRARWEAMDSEVVPWHWNDQDQLFADYTYLSGFYERLLPVIAAELNRIHGVDHPLRYWRILIGPWLAQFLHVLFDRWRSIEEASRRFEISRTVLLIGREDAAVPNDMNQFVSLIPTDQWNHYIFGQILEHASSISIARQAAGQPLAPTLELAADVGLKQRLLSAYARLARYGKRERDVFTIGTVLPVADEFRLQLRFGQVPQFWSTPSPVRIPVDWRQRSWKLQGTGATAFETMALSLVPKQIPVLFLEGYRRLKDQIEGLAWPKRTRLIFSAAALLDDTVSAAYAAEKVSRGAPLVFAQHGGGYGTAKFTWAEDHEVAISDRFLTWGWDDPARPKVNPVGMLRRRGQSGKSPNAADTLLLVILDAPRFSSWLSSGSWFFYLKYTEEALKFAEAVPGTIRRHLVVRHNAKDLGWNQTARWEDRLPEVRRDAGVSRMKDLVLDARLGVYTYNSTGVLEAFAWDRPSILVWDPALGPLRASAVPYFDALRRVGILHDSAESAARHVAAVWDDVEAWWYGPPVRETLASFTARYCFAPLDLVDRLEAALRGVMSDAARESPDPHPRRNSLASDPS